MVNSVNQVEYLADTFNTVDVSYNRPSHDNLLYHIQAYRRFLFPTIKSIQPKFIVFTRRTGQTTPSQFLCKFCRNATTQKNNDNTQISSAVTHASGNEAHVTYKNLLKRISHLLPFADLQISRSAWGGMIPNEGSFLMCLTTDGICYYCPSQHLLLKLL